MRAILITILMILSSICLGQEDRFGFVFDANLDSKIPEINTSNFGKKIINGEEILSAARLPKFVDNTLNRYFPPIISQIGGSCAQASGTGYVYNYEINFLLDRDGKKQENLLSYMQMWNYLNGGVGRGSNASQGWEIIKENGGICQDVFNPTIEDIGCKQRWAKGYSNYYKGMYYGVESVSKFKPYKTEATSSYDVNVISAMKQYLFDHADGSKVGGLIIFSANAHSMNCDKNYNGESNTGYKSIVNAFAPGSSGAHSMTIVGYDDDVVASDGSKGAFIVMNSWGEDWGDRGRFYMPYELIKSLNGGTGYGLTYCKNCYIVKPKYNQPKLACRIKLSHTSRNDIKLKIGVASGKDAEKPEEIHELYVMGRQGGDRPLSGIPNDNELEFGINLSRYVEYIEGGKEATFFIEIDNNQYVNESGEGEFLKCELLDYTSDIQNPKIYESEIVNKDLSLLISSVAKINYCDKVIPDCEQFCLFSEYNRDTYQLYINISSKQKNKAYIDLVNDEGLIVRTIFNSWINVESTVKKLDLKSLPKGKYVLRAIVEGHAEFRKIVIS
ncbi:MAG: hypothetical protein N4A32_01150 [Marinifilaceae bacterium]|nr:hypothetical protein [Marinifilaceae bacterium]